MHADDANQIYISFDQFQFQGPRWGNSRGDTTIDGTMVHSLEILLVTLGAFFQFQQINIP